MATLASAATLVLAQSAVAEVMTETYVVSAGETERKQTPVSIDIALPDAYRPARQGNDQCFTGDGSAG